MFRKQTYMTVQTQLRWYNKYLIVTSYNFHDFDDGIQSADISKGEKIGAAQVVLRYRE